MNMMSIAKQKLRGSSHLTVLKVPNLYEISWNYVHHKILYICIQEAEKKAGHSTLLADKPDLYEILVDDVKPEKWEEYLKHKGNIYILDVDPIKKEYYNRILT